MTFQNPAVAAIAADLAAVADLGGTDAGPWIDLWSKVEGLPGAGDAAAGGEVAILRDRTLEAAAAALKVANLGDCVSAARVLVSATVTVFNGQPDAKAWPSRVGRIVSADVIAGDYESLMQAMRDFGAKVGALDDAIKAARDRDVLWLLPEGSLRCPLGAAEVLRVLAARANLISTPQDMAGMNRLLGSLAMFSSPGRTQQTLSAMTQPFRTEMIEYAREAHAQLKILKQEGPVGTAEQALCARPFRFRGIEVNSSSSSALVLGTAFWLASGAILSVIAKSMPPVAAGAAGLAMFGLSTVCAMLPARQERRDRWNEAVAAAAHAVEVLREALEVKKKPAAEPQAKAPAP